MGRKKELYPQGIFHLRENQGVNENGEYPLYIRYNYDRKLADASMGVAIKKSDWNIKTQRIRSTHPQSGRLNAILEKNKTDIDAKIIDYVSENKLTIQVLREIVGGTFTKKAKPEDTDFIQYTIKI